MKILLKGQMITRLGL